MNKLFLNILVLLLMHSFCDGQITRPPVWGIAKMTFFIGSFDAAEEYYGDFLGFEKAFSYQTEYGKTVSYKVNDRQFLEFAIKPEYYAENQLIKVSFDCDNIENMHQYLLKNEVEIEKGPHLDEAGNKVFILESPDNYKVEFIHFMPKSLHKKSKGKHLSSKSIALRLHHAGLYTSSLEAANAFYKDILGFKEMWRAYRDSKAKPNYIYMQIPNCVENIEYLIVDDPYISHPCFELSDMQDAIYTLKERSNGQRINKPKIGKSNRWLLNMKNTEGLRIEFTESHTIR